MKPQIPSEPNVSASCTPAAKSTSHNVLVRVADRRTETQSSQSRANKTSIIIIKHPHSSRMSAGNAGKITKNPVPQAPVASGRHTSPLERGYSWPIAASASLGEFADCPDSAVFLDSAGCLADSLSGNRRRWRAFVIATMPDCRSPGLPGQMPHNSIADG